MTEQNENDKFEKFADRIYALANEMGIHSYVMLTDTGERMYATRFPDCEPTCDSPEECAAKIYMVASEEFLDFAKKVMQGDLVEQESRAKEGAA